jgi:hypothetical protein
MSAIDIHRRSAGHLRTTSFNRSARFGRAAVDVLALYASVAFCLESCHQPSAHARTGSTAYRLDNNLWSSQSLPPRRAPFAAIFRMAYTCAAVSASAGMFCACSWSHIARIDLPACRWLLAICAAYRFMRICFAVAHM